ncbi:uncharacterized protein LOC135370697 isoform X2 [Ornithodoros turicata]|uniref:uncharacterized protein LOC135370697 isoform X2 n=1 Tax=Ornithodoros turicata TaxID=34597 RepID=UPI003138CB76
MPHGLKRIAFHIKLGHSNHSGNTSSFLSHSQVCERYREKVRRFALENKRLAKALADAKQRIKTDVHCRRRHLQVKTWLEQNAIHIRALEANHNKAVKLMGEILDPNADLALVDDEGCSPKSPSPKPVLKPPGTIARLVFTMPALPETEEEHAECDKDKARTGRTKRGSKGKSKRRSCDAAVAKVDVRKGVVQRSPEYGSKAPVALHSNTSLTIKPHQGSELRTDRNEETSVPQDPNPKSAIISKDRCSAKSLLRGLQERTSEYNGQATANQGTSSITVPSQSGRERSQPPSKEEVRSRSAHLGAPCKKDTNRGSYKLHAPSTTASAHSPEAPCSDHENTTKDAAAGTASSRKTSAMSTDNIFTKMSVNEVHANPNCAVKEERDEGKRSGGGSRNKRPLSDINDIGRPVQATPSLTQVTVTGYRQLPDAAAVVPDALASVIGQSAETFRDPLLDDVVTSTRPQRSRRSTARRTSYQEPSLNTKLRRP